LEESLKGAKDFIHPRAFFSGLELKAISPNLEPLSDAIGFS
jgi:hypothetical protein